MKFSTRNFQLVGHTSIVGRFADRELDLEQ